MSYCGINGLYGEAANHAQWRSPQFTSVLLLNTSSIFAFVTCVLLKLNCDPCLLIIKISLHVRQSIANNILAPATEGFTPVIFWDTPLCHILSASFARFNSCPGTLSSGQLMFFLSYKFYLNEAVTKMRRNESIFAVIYSPSGAQSVYLIHQSPHCFYSVWSPITLTSLCWINLMAICGHKCGILGAHQ